MKTSIIKLSIFIVASILFAACTKEVPKELLNKEKSLQQQQMPNDSIHRNLTKNQGDTSKSGGDSKADELMKAADDAEAQYNKTKSEADKKTCIQRQMAAANYLMFDANLSPKKKYRPALQRYRKVLELDPSNKEAKENKQQIEDIYKSMGMPVPD
jgi:tetratricopeptide (TPR) repeat protein